nr:retrovirus-related Pol polyprotein from transposon TNT 1-94 [Tanacetum cinerariifolium]
MDQSAGLRMFGSDTFKLDRMDGMNFARWKEKMKFLLITFKFPNSKILTLKSPKKLLVGAIITKLPSSWHNYRKKLMHTLEDFTLDQIQKHLRIKKETHIHEKNPNDASSSKVNYVDSGKNNKGNDKKRKGTWNSSKDNKKDMKPLYEVVCYKCGDKGHIKCYCKNPKKKNHNSNKKDEYANTVEQVDTTEITAMVFEMNIGMIQEQHMASVTTTTDDWWHDSGATIHVYNNKDLFKTYKEIKDGHEVMMGDNHTSKGYGYDRVRQSDHVQSQCDNENVINIIPVLLNVEDAPKTYEDAITYRNFAFWKEAIDDEMDFLISNNTWELLNLPLGIKVKRHSGGYALNRCHYIDKIIDKFQRLNIEEKNIPYESSCKLIENNGRAVAQIEYTSVIGCLMYATHCTRPDIAYVVCKILRYTRNPSQDHWKAIQRVLGYLKRTRQSTLYLDCFLAVLERYSDVSRIIGSSDSKSKTG